MDKCTALYGTHHYDSEIKDCPICSKLPRDKITTIEEVYRIIGKPCPTKLNKIEDEPRKVDELEKELKLITTRKKVKR